MDMILYKANGMHEMVLFKILLLQKKGLLRSILFLGKNNCAQKTYAVSHNISFS